MVELISAEKNELLLKVVGSVTVNNAKEFGDELMAAHNDYPNVKMVIDMSGLEYISSAGLRALLILAKALEEKASLINVSDDIMDIFEDTGFNKLFDVSKPLKSVSIEGCDVVGKGANGVVYRISDEQIIKVFKEGVPLSYVRNERDLAQKSLLYGIPTAITFNVVKVGEQYGSIFELIDAKSLSKTINDNPEAFDIYKDEYVDVLKRLHQIKAEKSEFRSIKDIYHGYINDCLDWYSEDEIKLLREVVDSVPDVDTLIHGDYHANNILISDGKLTLIDMGDVSRGHPVFDFLATAATQVNLVELNPDFAQMHTGMSVAMIKKLWRYLIDTYFADKTTQEKETIEAQIKLFSKLKVALAPAVGKGVDEAIIKASIDDAKNNFLPKAKELIGTVNW